MKQATKEQEIRAGELYATDWDEDSTVTISLPIVVVRAALAQRDWIAPAGVHEYMSPHGFRSWEIDEALRIAITAEVM